MKLSELIKDVALWEKNWQMEMDPNINSIHYRSQTVLPGGIFVAIKGQHADGHEFINDAVNRGASAVVSEKAVNPDAVVVRVENSRKTLAVMSSRFYGAPSLGLCMVGVTGTNGKTTTTYLIERMLQKAGFNVGVIGTINYRYGGNSFDNPMTTPESLDLQSILGEMKAHGVSHVVMEVSSHAIDLERVAHCYFDVGVFTNLSQDHLDYHGDMGAYWSCKRKFFTDHLSSGPKRDEAIAVINCDNENGVELYQALSIRKISVGSVKKADVGLQKCHSDLKGNSGKIATFLGDVFFKSSLVGEYNVENILCATGAGTALNLPLDAVSSGIRDTGYVPGRLELIENDSGKYVFVDYAHTPDALEHALNALAEMKTPKSKIICAFGCGGDRDKTKRPLMGEIAGRFCDLVIITTDNPRTEAPVDIIRQIEKGVLKTAGQFYGDLARQTDIQEKGYAIEKDRKKAIALGIKTADRGDIILIAGKGHETYQIIGETSVHFDDREVARDVLNSVFCRRLS